MIAATVRWIHSTQAFASPRGGMTWPWHSGQSGQPMPEPVTRTMTPIVTSRIVATTVARAVFGRGVPAGGGPPGLGEPRAGAGAGNPFYARAADGDPGRSRRRRATGATL